MLSSWVILPRFCVLFLKKIKLKYFFRENKEPFQTLYMLLLKYSEISILRLVVFVVRDKLLTSSKVFQNSVKLLLQLKRCSRWSKVYRRWLEFQRKETREKRKGRKKNFVTERNTLCAHLSVRCSNSIRNVWTSGKRTGRATNKYVYQRRR